MSRKKSFANAREFEPDLKYKNILVTRFINKMMWEGKKSISETLFYEALEKAAAKEKVDPIVMFNKAIENISPSKRLKATPIGGATYQVPYKVDPDKAKLIACGWIIKSSRLNKSEKSFADKLANEFVDAYNGRGASFKIKEDIHKMVKSNEAFAHLARN